MLHWSAFAINSALSHSSNILRKKKKPANSYILPKELQVKPTKNEERPFLCPVSMLRFIYSAQLKVLKPKKPHLFQLLPSLPPLVFQPKPLHCPSTLEKCSQNQQARTIHLTSSVTSRQFWAALQAAQSPGWAGQADSPTGSCWSPRCPWWSGARPAGWSCGTCGATAAAALPSARCSPHCPWSSPPETHVQAPG